MNEQNAQAVEWTEADEAAYQEDQDRQEAEYEEGVAAYYRGRGQGNLY